MENNKIKMSEDKVTGLVMVITGNGKGKTTSALGMMLRAWGQNLRVAMLQFVKSSDSDYGEQRALQRLGLEIVTCGSGFTWIGKNAEKNRVQSNQLWNLAKEKMASGKYDLLVLDEFTYALKYGWVAVPEVLEALKNRPPRLHVVITGRDALSQLIELADSAVEIRQIKHHLEKGIKAQVGIEF